MKKQPIFVAVDTNNIKRATENKTEPKVEKEVKKKEVEK